MIIMLALIVPAALLTARAYYNVRSEALHRSEDRLNTQALTAVNSVYGHLRSTQALLAIAKTADWVSSGDIGKCKANARRIVAHGDGISNVSVFDADGNYLCGSHQPIWKGGFADRGWFKEVKNTGEFTVSELVLGRVTGLPSLVLADQVPAANGTPGRIISASIPASHLRRDLEALDRGPDTVISVVDSQGITVARVPDHGRWAGREVIEPALRQAFVDGVRNKTVVGADGWTYRVQAVDPQSNLQVVVAARSAAAVSSLNRMFLENIAIYGAIALIVGWLAWLASERIVVRGVDAELRAGLLNTIGTLGNAVDARDPYTAGHQARVAHLATAIGRRMGLSPDRLEGLHLGALIHDIGKLTVPTAILTKSSPLTDDEFALIKGHSKAGYAIVKDTQFRWPIAEMVYQHHERLDGSGYPRGLKGDQIILEARIIAVADVVEAITSPRPYRAALGINVALKEIQDRAGTAYDPKVAKAVVELFTQDAYELPSPQIKEFPSIAAAPAYT